MSRLLCPPGTFYERLVYSSRFNLKTLLLFTLGNLIIFNGYLFLDEEIITIRPLMTSVHSGPYMSIDMIPGKYSCVLEKKIHRVSRCGVRVYTFVCVCMYD